MVAVTGYNALDLTVLSGEADVAPTIHLPSEDSKLSDFLRGLESVSPVRSGIAGTSPSGGLATAPAAVATGSNPALQQTIVSSGAQSDTDLDAPTPDLTEEAPFSQGLTRFLSGIHADRAETSSKDRRSRVRLYFAT